jgi:hypothetical protein
MPVKPPRRAALRELRRGDLAEPRSLPSWFHRVGRMRFAHRTMGRSVEETGCGKRTT